MESTEDDTPTGSPCAPKDQIADINSANEGMVHNVNVLNTDDVFCNVEVNSSSDVVDFNFNPCPTTLRRDCLIGYSHIAQRLTTSPADVELRMCSVMFTSI